LHQFGVSLDREVRRLKTGAAVVVIAQRFSECAFEGFARWSDDQFNAGQFGNQVLRGAFITAVGNEQDAIRGNDNSAGGGKKACELSNVRQRRHEEGVEIRVAHQRAKTREPRQAQRGRRSLH
jgi:hypothetical protein